MNRNPRSLGFYVVLGLLFVVMVFGLRETLNTRTSLTWKQFMEMLDADQISGVTITQNKEVPTGILEISLGSAGDNSPARTETLYVSDVIKAQEVLEDYDVPVHVEDVERDSFFLTTILPILLMGMMILFFMAMMNRQSGGNARMMDFGRSRVHVSRRA